MGLYINQCFKQLLPATALTVVLLLPFVVRAVGIGEIVLQSKLGEPLLAQVELRAADDETIDASCLSLAAPDPNDDEADNYLLGARLDIKTEGARRYVVIRSRKTLDAPFAKLRLQIYCPGMGSIVKTLTILPGLDAMPRAASAAPATGTSARAFFGEGESAPKIMATVRRSRTQTARNEQGRLATYWLRISGAPMDELRIGNTNQGTELWDGLGGIKLKLAWLVSFPPGAASIASSVEGMPESVLETAGERSVAAVTKAPETVRQDNPLLQRGLLAAGLALVITIALLFARRHIRLNSRQAAKDRLDSQQSANEAKRALNEKRTLVFKSR